MIKNNVSKDAQFTETDFCVLEVFFFLRLLVFEMYLVDFVTDINSELVWDLKDFCEPYSDANQ